MSKVKTTRTLGDAKMPTLRDKINQIETPVAPAPSKKKGLGRKVGKSK